LAKGKVVTKIAEKIQKGYYSTTAKKIAVPETPTKKPVLRKRIEKMEQTAESEETKKKPRRRKNDN